MTGPHIAVLVLLVIGIVVGVYGIRMERRARREFRAEYDRVIDRAIRQHPSYDDMARDVAAEDQFTREHLNGIRAAEMHE